MIVDAVIRIGCIWEKHGVKLKNIFQNEKPRQGPWATLQIVDVDPEPHSKS